MVPRVTVIDRFHSLSMAPRVTVIDRVLSALLYFQDRLVSGEPEKGSKRFEELKQNKQTMVDAVMKIVNERRDSQTQHEELPFIDSLLQNYSSEDKVS